MCLQAIGLPSLPVRCHWEGVKEAHATPKIRLPGFSELGCVTVGHPAAEGLPPSR